MSLRPERITINPKAKSVPNIVEGKIAELIYLGDHIRTRMVVADSDEFIVKIPNAFGQAALKEGTSVKVGWETEDCRALDPL